MGKVPILTHMFQRGWFNHQLEKNIFFSPKKFWYLHEMFVVERLPPPWSQLRPSPIRNLPFEPRSSQFKKKTGRSWWKLGRDPILRAQSFHSWVVSATKLVLCLFISWFCTGCTMVNHHENTIWGICLFFSQHLMQIQDLWKVPTLLQKHLHEKYHEMCNESGEPRYLVFTRCQYALLPRKLTWKWKIPSHGWRCISY